MFLFLLLLLLLLLLLSLLLLLLLSGLQLYRTIFVATDVKLSITSPRCIVLNMLGLRRRGPGSAGPITVTF